MNDIVNNAPNMNTVIFADNTDILFTGIYPVRIVDRPISTLFNQDLCFESNHLTLNEEKTLYMAIHRSQSRTQFDHDVYLGVMFLFLLAVFKT